MNKTSTYKDLIVWQKSIDLVEAIYVLTKNLPEVEKYNLVQQLNRAAISVPANIAEGWGRESRKNYVQFLRIARGSLFELETLCTIASRLRYDLDNEILNVSSLIEEVGKMLNALIKSIRQKEEEPVIA